MTTPTTSPTHSLEPYLAEHPFFKDLDPAHIKWLTECASNARYDAGEYLFHEGETADRLYLIRHGKVAVQYFTRNSGPIAIQTLREGDVLGWSWLMPPYKVHFDAMALEMTRVIALDGRCMQRKCNEDPKLGYELMRRVAEILVARLRSTLLQLVEAYDDHMA